MCGLWIETVGNSQWDTRSFERTALVVVHTATTADRLMDVLPLLESDPRVRVLFTAAPDVFGADVEEILGGLGVRTLPWSQARRMPFDLAVSAAYGGIGDLNAPVMVLPHGAGYNKYPVRWNGHGPSAGRVPFGLGQELVRNGRVLASSVVLSSVDQLRQLDQTCPDAVPAAVVAGDPCRDRMVAARRRRGEFRRALGVRSDQRLVVVSSTWGTRSLFGAQSEVYSALAGLPRDRYRVVALFHPNIWATYGRRALGRWLAEPIRAGLDVIDPTRGWQAAVVAADAVVSDQGSVSLYAAACGVPVLLAAFPHEELHPGSAAAALASVAPSLFRDRPLADQIEVSVARHDRRRFRTATRLVTSEPGRAASLLRREMYHLMRLPEPDVPAHLDPLPPPRVIAW